MSINNVVGSVGLPSASGYNVVAQALESPIYSKVFIKRLNAESISGLITDQNVVPSELRTSGDLAIMRREPRGEIFRYTKNQHLEVSQITSTSLTFKVDKAWYWNVKFDEVDVTQMGDIKQWLKMFQDNSLQQLAMQIDHDILQDMVIQAAPCNKGAKAGVRSHAYNLGATGAPLELTSNGPVNPLTLAVTLQAVLSEQNAPQRDSFIVWPQMVKPLFLSTNTLANVYQSGLGRSSLISGEVSDVLGVKHYFTPNMPTYHDPVLPGVTTYPVIFGIKSATGFVNQLTKTKYIENDPRSFANYWRGLQLSGWGVIRPELLAVAYVTVRTII
jgi:hypothetical protein